jgi:thiamine-phosphate pyrophosphorylase
VIQKTQIDWSLYGIVDRQWVDDESLERTTEALIRGGAGIVQYRDKESETRDFYQMASRLRKVTSRFGIPFIINDRTDVALAVQADGVHLGQKDLPLHVARRMIGKERIIGISVSRWEEYEAVSHADYVGIGALFSTRTKTDAELSNIDLVQRIRSKTSLPLVGIGGISLDNVEAVIRAGCDGVAVISAILGSGQIEQCAKQFKEIIQSAKGNRQPIA